MAELLLINPGRKVKPMAKKRRGRSAAQKRATAKLIAYNKSRRAGRSRSAAPKRRRARRRSNPIANPIVRRVARRVRRASYGGRRRRRNPISIGGASGYMAMFKNAVIEGGGAVALDIGFGYVNGTLPATLQRKPGTVGIGDAVKAVFTVAVGKLLNRATRGLSMRAARGSLTVQAYDLASTLLPAGVSVAGRLGYAVPGRVVNYSARVGPNIAGRLGAYMAPGQTVLLNGGRVAGRMGAYMAPGATPLLSGGARQREGWGGRR